MKNPQIKVKGEKFSGQVKQLRIYEPQRSDWIPEEEAANYVNFEQLYADKNNHTYIPASGHVRDRVIVNVSPDIMPRKRITQNGRYLASIDGVDAYKKVIVDVSHEGEGETKEITANGTYYALPGHFWDEVHVSVEEPLPPDPHPELVGSKTITENGLYYASDDNLSGYSPVTVQVRSKDYGYAWEQVATNMAIYQSNISSCVHNNNLCVFMGNEYHIYDKDGVIVTEGILPFSADGMSAISVGGEVHLIGGTGNNTLHKITTNFSTWRNPVIPPPTCISPNLVTDGLYIYMVGASDSSHDNDDATHILHVFITDIGLWGTMGEMPSHFYASDDAVFYNGCIHIWKSTIHYIFNPEISYEWRTGGSVPGYFGFAENYNLAVLEGSILMFNCYTGSTDAGVASYTEDGVSGAGKYRMESWIPYTWYVSQYHSGPGQRVQAMQDGIHVFGCSGGSGSNQHYVTYKIV